MSATLSAIEAWRTARVRAVNARTDRHSIHTYFNTCPESPDGQWVVAFVSSQPEGEVGDVVLIEREGGKVRTLATGVTCEDSHRQAYQQWSGNGRYVVYQDLRDGEWQIHRVDVATGKDEVLATGWQMAFGRPDQHVVPLHGPHWAPGEHRDVVLLDVETGKQRVGVSNEAVREALPEFMQEHFADGQPTSLFFPNISPSGQRVFFKVASVNSGQFQSPDASHRHGLIVYDMAQERVLYAGIVWGHPAWSPDSSRIVTPIQNQLHEIDCVTGTVTRLDKLPDVPGSHPNYCPTDARLITTDAYLRGPDIPRGWWGVWVGLPETGETTWLHQLNELPDTAQRSWRPPHPHPVFSGDGKRLYFNVSVGKWTRVHVAEIG